MVDRKTTSHSAALRRLSARAATTAVPQPFNSSSPGLHRLLLAGVRIRPGLSESELYRVESQFGFAFPPDLRHLLSSGLPVGPRFSDWRNSGERNIRSSIDFPIAAVSLQITTGGLLWFGSWGTRPVDPKKAIRVARGFMKKSPLLIPLFGRCYIPCNPPLSGNPIFFVDENRVVCCGSDLSDFFLRSSSFSGDGRSAVCGGVTAPRWVEFWSEAAAHCRRRRVFSTPESCSVKAAVEAGFVAEFIQRMGFVLKEGGWSESDVEEIAHVSGEEVGYADSEAALDALMQTAGRVSGSLGRAGWSSEEVSEAILGLAKP